MKPVLARSDRCAQSPGPAAAGSSALASLLEGLGLASVAGAKRFRGEVVKKQRRGRDVLRIRVTDGEGDERVLYLKRTWNPHKKDGLGWLLRCGRVRSISWVERENYRALHAAGLSTPEVLAFGEDCGPFWERFSYIVTEAARGAQTVAEFLATCAEPARRRRVFDALAAEIRRMHEAGLASPDLFTRHVFVEESADPPAFCFIDVARLDRRRAVPDRLRARDLAALNATAPLRFVTARERLRFLRVYGRGGGRKLLGLIRRRMAHLLRRRKFGDFAQGPAPRPTEGRGAPERGARGGRESLYPSGDLPDLARGARS